ncbi:Demethylmenaquinone methyltransferase, partial [hydrothermal vent metagenome]
MYDNTYMNSTETKAKAVREMFSSIARRYDFLNHFLSLGIDIRWRKEAVALFGSLAGKNVLDVACGTGDLAIAIVKAGDDTTTVT